MRVLPAKWEIENPLLSLPAPRPSGSFVWGKTGYMKKPLRLAHQGLYKSGAGEMNRTPDLLITNEGIGVFACVD